MTRSRKLTISYHSTGKYSSVRIHEVFDYDLSFYRHIVAPGMITFDHSPQSIATPRNWIAV